MVSMGNMVSLKKLLYIKYIIITFYYIKSYSIAFDIYICMYSYIRVYIGSDLYKKNLLSR